MVLCLRNSEKLETSCATTPQVSGLLGLSEILVRQHLSTLTRSLSSLQAGFRITWSLESSLLWYQTAATICRNLTRHVSDLLGLSKISNTSKLWPESFVVVGLSQIYLDARKFLAIAQSPRYAVYLTSRRRVEPSLEMQATFSDTSLSCSTEVHSSCAHVTGPAVIPT